jgi:hypothetical protein
MTGVLEDPLATLGELHAQWPQRCDGLWRLVICLGQSGADARARRMAQELVDWFDEVGMTSLDREEPLLEAALAAEAPRRPRQAVAALGACLAGQRQRIHAQWEALRAQLAAAAQGHADARVVEAAWEFIETARRHLRLEERTLLPAARHTLNAEALRDVDRAVAGAVHTRGQSAGNEQRDRDRGRQWAGMTHLDPVRPPADVRNLA